MFRSALVITLVALSAASAAPAPKPAPTEFVQTIDAHNIAGRLVSISGDNLVVREAGGNRSLSLDGVDRVVLGEAEDLMTNADQAVLVTASGDILAVRGLSLAKEHFRFTNPMLGRIELAMGKVRRIYLPAPTESAADIDRKCREKKIAASTADMLVVRRKLGLLGVSGVLKTMDAISGADAKITFGWQGVDRKIAVTDVPVIMLAGSGAKPAKPAGTLTGRSGSRLNFSAVTLAGDSFRVTSESLGTRKVSRKTVAALRLHSPKVTSVVLLKPVGVKEHGFFDHTFAYRVNKSVGGKPIRLDGQTYETGLGLHSFCELTYRIDGRYERLVAIVGIDDSVRPAGDADLSFLGDGKALGQRVRVRGCDKAQTVRLDLTGIRELTIRAEFGHDKLDVSDHVDLADIRLIKPATPPATSKPAAPSN